MARKKPKRQAISQAASTVWEAAANLHEAGKSVRYRQHRVSSASPKWLTCTQLRRENGLGAATPGGDPGSMRGH